MVEWLQTRIFRPVIEVLLFMPVPLRYSIEVLLIVLLLIIVPIDIIVLPLMFITSVVLKGLRSVLSALEGLYAHKTTSSSALDIADRFLETLIVQVSRVIERLEIKRRISLRGWRPRKRVVGILLILPIILWLLLIPLKNTTVGHGLQNGYDQVGNFEGWAMTGYWQKNRERETPSINTVESKPEIRSVPTASSDATQEPNNQQAETIYVVKKGDILRQIAKQYSIKTSCIVEENKVRYENFNPDSLRIGMELHIPVNKPECKT